MPQFVNYKKRAFTLPPGCKDLIDVLAPSLRQKRTHIITGGFQPLEIKVERFPTAGLAQIGRYVSMLVHSRGEFFTLSLTAEDFDYPVTLYRSRSEQTAAIVLVTKDSHREQAIRAFFEQQGTKVLWDYPPSVLGPGDAAHGFVYPLPPDAASAASLTTELLRSVYGLNAEAGIDFRYYEMESAA
jgi:hypothetical protein